MKLELCSTDLMDVFEETTRYWYWRCECGERMRRATTKPTPARRSGLRHLAIVHPSPSL